MHTKYGIQIVGISAQSGSAIINIKVKNILRNKKIGRDYY